MVLKTWVMVSIHSMLPTFHFCEKLLLLNATTLQQKRNNLYLLHYFFRNKTQQLTQHHGGGIMEYDKNDKFDIMSCFECPYCHEFTVRWLNRKVWICDNCDKFIDPDIYLNHQLDDFVDLDESP